MVTTLPSSLLLWILFCAHDYLALVTPNVSFFISLRSFLYSLMNTSQSNKHANILLDRSKLYKLKLYYINSYFLIKIYKLSQVWCIKQIIYDHKFVNPFLMADKQEFPSSFWDGNIQDSPLYVNWETKENTTQLD